MNGKEAIKEIARMAQEGILRNKVPSILMVSAYAKEEIDLNDVKIDSFLTKPVTSSALFDAIAGAKNGIIRKFEAAKIKDVPDLSGITVLLVEDNEINREVAEMMLQRVGIKVETAGNGKEAVGTYLSDPEHFDLILMDLQMPVMSGYEATALVREHDKNVPIIALTAAAMVEDREKVLEAGMNDHLAKPIDTVELYATIAKWCGIDIPKTLKEPHRENGEQVLDLQSAANMLGGNLELLEKLLSKFLGQLEGEFDGIDILIAQGDPAAPPLVHALKGVSGNLGAKDVYALCQRIDAAYKAGKEVSAEDAGRLAFAIRKLKRALEAASPETRTVSAVPKPSRENLKKLYLQIQKDMREGNMVQEDDQKSFIEGVKERVDPSILKAWMAAMDGFDYDKALSIMGGWEIS